MEEDQVLVVDATPIGEWSGGGLRYRFQCSFPNIKVLEGKHDTKLSAYDEGAEWARNYEAADRLGNMACVVGVTVTTVSTQFLVALKYFEVAAYQLDRAWDNCAMQFNEDYPCSFQSSLDEILPEITKWRETCEQRAEYSAVVNYFHSNT